METSRLHEKLILIQTELKAKKNKTNSFGKYKYRSADDILEALKPFCKKYAVYITVTEDLFSEAVLNSTATISDGKEKISANAYVGVDINQKGQSLPQKYGTASSYAKKYALGNLLLIDDTADDDATNKHGKPAKKTLDKSVINSINHYVEIGMSFDTFIENVKEIGYNLDQVDLDVMAKRWVDETNKIAI
tara:strand:+ start:68 stop:640 length:573 start_codon:yes stop_codon:yes gene_type:complete